MYVIKDTKCWEKNKKPKKEKKVENHHPPCALSAHSSDLLASTLLVCAPPSALSPGRGKKPGDRVALGTCFQVPTSSPSAGLGGVSGLFMYLLHTHQPMQVPTPAPPCFCAFAHSPQAPRASPAPFPLATGSGMDGPPRFGISRVSLSWDPHLSLAGSVLFTPRQGELTLPGTGRW